MSLKVFQTKKRHKTRRSNISTFSLFWFSKLFSHQYRKIKTKGEGGIFYVLHIQTTLHTFWRWIISKKGEESIWWILPFLWSLTKQVKIWSYWCRWIEMGEIALCGMESINRSTPSEVFLRKGVLKICSKFTGEQLCQSGW